MDGLEWKSLLKWMIGGVTYFWETSITGNPWIPPDWRACQSKSHFPAELRSARDHAKGSNSGKTTRSGALLKAVFFRKNSTRETARLIKKLHPRRLTWNLRIHPWKRKIIFQTIIFRCYVNLWGCSLDFFVPGKTTKKRRTELHTLTHFMVVATGSYGIPGPKTPRDLVDTPGTLGMGTPTSKAEKHGGWEVSICWNGIGWSWKP